ncbi:MAG: hypothetical protein WC012_07365 [Thiohalomonadaceae bacterium]
MRMLDQVFLLSHSGLTAFRLCAGRVVEAIHFDDSDAGRQAFARYLAEGRALPTALLVDRADEEFRIETVPHVVRARGELLARHGVRLFGGTQFRSARVLGREAQGRRDDRVLFSALTHPEALDPWLAAMAEAHLPVAAIESVAAVSARMLAVLHTRGTVLLALAGAGELRQSVFVDGILQFSRLAPLAGPEPEVKAQALRAEVMRTWHYVQRQVLASDPGPIVTHVVADTALAGPLAGPGTADLAVTALPTVAAALGCSHHTAQDAGVLLAELMARAASNRYARKEERRHYMRLRRRRAITTACWCVAAMALLAATHELGMGLGARATAVALSAETAALHARLAGDTQPDEAARVRAEVEAADRLLASRRSPRAVLGGVGAVLAAFPEIQLDTLAFDLAGDTDAAPHASLSLRGHMGAPRIPPERFAAFTEALRSSTNHRELHVTAPPHGETAAFELALELASP